MTALKGQLKRVRLCCIARVHAQFLCGFAEHLQLCSELKTSEKLRFVLAVYSDLLKAVRAQGGKADMNSNLLQSFKNMDLMTGAAGTPRNTANTGQEEYSRCLTVLDQQYDINFDSSSE